MNRKQFMEQLERLLSDISEAERQEALEYYEEYMNIKPNCFRMSVEELTIYPDKEYKGENE